MVKQIPEHTMEAAKGNITAEKKDNKNNIGSKILLKKETSRHGHEKNWMVNKHPTGKEGRRNDTIPIKATPQKDDHNNGTLNIKFILYKRGCEH